MHCGKIRGNSLFRVPAGLAVQNVRIWSAAAPQFDADIPQQRARRGLLACGGRQVPGPRLHGGRLLQFLVSIVGLGEFLWRRGEAGAFEGHCLTEWRRQPTSWGEFGSRGLGCGEEIGDSRISSLRLVSRSMWGSGTVCGRSGFTGGGGGRYRRGPVVLRGVILSGDSACPYQIHRRSGILDRSLP